MTFINWCYKRNVICSIEMNCSQCYNRMTLQKCSNSVDGMKFSCNNCKSKRSIRNGCWDYDSKLPLRKLVIISDCWCDKKSNHNAIYMTGLSEKTIIKYFSLFRRFAEFLYRNNISNHPLGNGPGSVCEIDESFFGKAKYHRGRSLKTQQWAFGIYDRSDGRTMIEFVNNRDEDILVPIVQSSVTTGTTIYSDC